MPGRKRRKREFDALVKLMGIYGGIAAVAGFLLALWQANRTLGAFYGGMAIVLLTGGTIIWLWIHKKPDGNGPKNQVEPGKVEVKTGTTDSDEERLRIELRLITRNSDGGPAGDQVTLSWATLMAGADKLREYVDQDEVEFTACIGINASGLILANYIGDRCGVNRSCIGTFLTSGKNGKRKIDLALPLKAEKSRLDLAFSGSVLVVDSELKTGVSFRLASEYLMDKCKCDEHKIRYAVLMICKVNPEEFKKARLARESKERSWLKKLSQYGSDRDSHDSDWPIPHYIAYCTPGKVEMPEKVN